tara:strand:- start:148 stop:852 length:705 start_codon:yes stop_codon:yes gene_type:complete
MSINPDKWIETIPNTKSEENNIELDHDKWISTLPKKNNSVTKYSITAFVFIIGLVFVSTIKNETRNLQKEISNLKASIKSLELNLGKASLDHEVITTPANISLLAKQYLEFELVPYKQKQIKHLDDQINEEDFKKIMEQAKKEDNLKDKMKVKLAKKVYKKKQELKKLQEMYSNPKSIPGEVKIKIAKKIEEKKGELKQMYESPSEIISLEKVQKWGAIQIVKAFLGIPIIPGK